MEYPGYRKRTIVLLLGLLLVRFWFGQTFELSGEEAYLWLQGHGGNLSASYWERGPFVPWLIHMGTLFFGDTELGVRWPAANIACLTGFVLFYLARHWFTAQAAFWTVVLFIIIPMYAWKLSFMTEATASIGLMALAMLAFSHAIERDKLGWWLMGGAACGLGLLVDIANVWWLIGLVVYFGVSPARRVRLREPRLWITFVFALLFLTPIIWWWCGPQVAGVCRLHFMGEWPRSFSFNQGFHFIALELFYLCPVFFIVLVMVLRQLGRALWEDPRYGLLACLALPGLIWQNVCAFFNEGHFALLPALFLPLILLAGCCAIRLLPEPRLRRSILGIVFALAAVQSLAGLNPFYLLHEDGRPWSIWRATSGENVTGFYANKRQISWRNLADQMVQMQREVGANLIIADEPETASALSFYMPRNPTIYVESKRVTQFDFWTHFDEAASSNDSAIFLTRSNDSSAPADVVKNFASVTPMEDPPLPGFNKSWNLWNCQKFIGHGGAPAPGTGPDSAPAPETAPEAMPK